MNARTGYICARCGQYHSELPLNYMTKSIEGNIQCSFVYLSRFPLFHIPIQYVNSN